MSQVTEQSVRFQTALASIKLIQASAVLDLTEDDFDFLTSNKVWIATDRSRARRCVEACVYASPHPTRQFLTESLVDGERSQSKSFSSCARIGRIFSFSASSPLRFNS